MGGREADGDKIQWARLNQLWFDRIVETLLMRKFRGVATVDVVNGRGGDGGVDVSVTYPDGRLVIYQLKYYPEGMSGGFVGRRDKVKKSFVQAVKEQEPHEWVLVAPCNNFTNPEKSYIRRLPEAFTPEGDTGDGEVCDHDPFQRPPQPGARELRAWLRSGAGVLAPHVSAVGTAVAAHYNFQHGRSPAQRLVGQPPDHGVTSSAFAAAPSAPLIWFHHAAR